MEKTQETIEILKTYNQEHIIKLMEKMTEEERKNLIEQINNIDFHQVIELYDNAQKPVEIKENKIECNLEKTNAYVFSNNENNYKNFDKEIKFYDKNNIKYKVLSSLPINYPSKVVLETYDSYTFNPYKYLIGLKKIIKDKI